MAKKEEKTKKLKINTIKKKPAKKSIKKEKIKKGKYTIDKDIREMNNNLSDEARLDRFTTLFHHDFMRKTIALITGGLLGALALTMFVGPANLLSSGFTGLALSLSRIMPGLELNVLLVVLNLPAFIFGIFFVGKKFSIFSIIFTVIVSLWMIPLEALDFTILSDAQGEHRLLAVVFGSLTYGTGVALLFKAGISTGGVDYFTIYISRKKQIQAGKVTMVFLFITLMTAALMETIHKTPTKPWNVVDETLAYTIIGLFIESKLIDVIYPKYKKFRIAITTEEKSVTAILNEVAKSGYDRTFTVMNGTGTYSGAEKKILVTICSYYEVQNILLSAKKGDPKLFASISRVSKVEGQFEIR